MSKSKTSNDKKNVGSAGVMTVVDYNKKMGVYKYLSLYPQDIYISNLLKKLYPTKIQTKSQWDKTVEDLLKTNLK